MPSSHKITFNLDKLNKVIKNFDNTHVIKVGVLSKDSSRSSLASTNADIGLQHEVGSLSGKVPKRSWLVEPLEDHGSELTKTVGKILSDSIAESGAKKLAMKRAGLAAEAIIQRGFESGGFGKWQDLSPKTIMRKGSAAKLIDSTEFRKSIHSQVVKAGA